MVSFSDLFTYTLVLIAIITLVGNRKEKQPPRPEKTSDYDSLVCFIISEQPLLFYGSTYF